MPTYIVFSLVAATFFATSLVVKKFVSKHTIEDKNTLTAYFIISCFFFALVLYPFINHSFPSFQVLLPVFFSGIFFLIGYYLFFLGISKVDVSTFAPLSQIQSGLIAILAYIFLGERFSQIYYLFFILIILGGVLVSIDEKFSLKSLLNVGIVYILGNQLFHAISNTFTGFSLANIDFVSFLFWQYLFVGVFLIPFVIIFKPKLNYPIKSLFPFIFSNFLGSTGALFLLVAFKTNLTISSAIALMLSPIVFVIVLFLSKFKPNLLEHHTKKVYLLRFIGVIILMSGVLGLSIF